MENQLDFRKFSISTVSPLFTENREVKLMVKIMCVKESKVLIAYSSIPTLII